MCRRSSLPTAEGVGEEPNHTTAKSPLQIIQYSLVELVQQRECSFLRRPESQAKANSLEETSKISVYDSLCGLAGGLGGMEGCRDGSVFVIICVCGTGACSIFFEIQRH